MLGGSPCALQVRWRKGAESHLDSVRAGSVLALLLINYLNLIVGDTGMRNGLFSLLRPVSWLGARGAADERGSGSVQEGAASASHHTPIPLTGARLRPRGVMARGAQAA